MHKYIPSDFYRPIYISREVLIARYIVRLLPQAINTPQAPGGKHLVGINFPRHRKYI